MRKLSKPKSKLRDVSEGSSHLTTTGRAQPVTKLLTKRLQTVKALADYAVHIGTRTHAPGISARERQLLAILDHSPNLVFVKDPEGRYLFVNQRFAEVFHLTREEIAGKTDRELFPARQATAFRLNDRKVLQAGIPLEFEEVAQHDDGPHTSIVFKFPLSDADGRTYAIGGITTDITDRKGMEHALRESQARLAMALDARQQLDADLHDNIIQMLYAVGMSLEQARHLLHYNVTATDDTLKGALSNLNHVIEDVRGYIGRQEPPRLCGNQLIATLSNLIQTMQEANGLRFTLQMDPSATQHLTAEQSLHLYSIAREAISNCFRHANAQHALLSLQVCGPSIRLEIQDDGIGFEQTQTGGLGHGLRNMQMRAQKLGGRLNIDAVPAKGTRIVTIIPQQHEAYRQQ
jgi:PAS domain S-box-containing protein